MTVEGIAVARIAIASELGGGLLLIAIATELALHDQDDLGH
jgi:hypothetical protein